MNFLKLYSSKMSIILAICLLDSQRYRDLRDWQGGLAYLT
ncbi:hypothetical protein SynA15127_02173 [Synechococcus sp. A15-127]|nr:hypothetical protein SynA15127_02173 [Synechococcus sp. A15-127]